MVNKALDDPFRIMREIGVLIDRSMLQIVNAMRHINLQEESPNNIRRVDQLTRALEYLCDVEEYNKKIEKKLYGMLKTNKLQKTIIQRHLKNNKSGLEGFDKTFTVHSKW